MSDGKSVTVTNVTKQEVDDVQKHTGWDREDCIQAVIIFKKTYPGWSRYRLNYMTKAEIDIAKPKPVA